MLHRNLALHLARVTARRPMLRRCASQARIARQASQERATTKGCNAGGAHGTTHWRARYDTLARPSSLAGAPQRLHAPSAAGATEQVCGGAGRGRNARGLPGAKSASAPRPPSRPWPLHRRRRRRRRRENQWSPCCCERPRPAQASPPSGAILWAPSPQEEVTRGGAGGGCGHGTRDGSGRVVGWGGGRGARLRVPRKVSQDLCGCLRGTAASRAKD
jgi:hypothetical protein